MTNHLTGQRFGRLTVVGRSFSKPNLGIYWLCLCDCGKEKSIRGAKLINGHTVSCGCAKGRHHHAGNNADRKPSQTYRSWKNMIARCTLPSNPAFEHYKKRGITVCDRWRTFENFLADMGERPGSKREYTIERIDNDLGYEPGNCRWATWKEQANNRTPNDNMRNPAAKLTDAQVAAIRSDPRPQYVIGDEYGVSQSHIGRIRRGVQRRA
jgi:hypothetical protein